MYVVHVCCVVCGCARMCHNIIVPPLQVRHIYTGPLDEEDEMAESMLTCDPEVREMRGEQLLGNTGGCLTRTQGWDGWNPPSFAVLLCLPSSTFASRLFLSLTCPSPSPTPSSQGPLTLHITKLYPSQDATIFHAFGRVMSGTGQLHLCVYSVRTHAHVHVVFSPYVQCTVGSRCVSLERTTPWKTRRTPQSDRSVATAGFVSTKDMLCL